MVSVPEFILHGLPTERYQAQLESVEDAATSALPPAGDVVPDHVVAYGFAGEKGLLTTPTRLEVYNVAERAQQDKVVKAVRAVLRHKLIIPVQMDFCQEQPLPQWRQGWRQGQCNAHRNDQGRLKRGGERFFASLRMSTRSAAAQCGVILSGADGDGSLDLAETCPNSRART